MRTGKRAARGQRKSGRMGRKVSAARGASRGWPYAPVPSSVMPSRGPRDRRWPPLLKCLPAVSRRGAPPSARAEVHSLSHQPFLWGSGRPGWVGR